MIHSQAADWSPLPSALPLVIAKRFSEKVRLERQLELALERDAIQDGRPADCWCLGAGGKSPRALPMPFTVYRQQPNDGEAVDTWPYVYEATCSCSEGDAERDRKDGLLKAYDAWEMKRCETAIWAAAGIPSRFALMSLDTSPLLKTAPSLINRLRGPGPPRCAPVMPGEAPKTPGNAPFPPGMPQEAALTQWGASWFFWGENGVGKTGLAVGLAREHLKHERLGARALHYILFKTAPAMLTHFRSTYGKEAQEAEAEVLALYTNPTTLLILDDLGAEQVRGTGWVEDRLYQVIGERHDNEVPTIFTSNKSLGELAAHIGERISWRIAEMCGKDRVIHVQGANLRA